MDGVITTLHTQSLLAFIQNTSSMHATLHPSWSHVTQGAKPGKVLNTIHLLSSSHIQWPPILSVPRGWKHNNTLYVECYPITSHIHHRPAQVPSGLNPRHVLVLVNSSVCHPRIGETSNCLTSSKATVGGECALQVCVFESAAGPVEKQEKQKQADTCRGGGTAGRYALQCYIFTCEDVLIHTHHCTHTHLHTYKIDMHTHSSSRSDTHTHALCTADLTNKVLAFVPLHSWHTVEHAGITAFIYSIITQLAEDSTLSTYWKKARRYLSKTTTTSGMKRILSDYLYTPGCTYTFVYPVFNHQLFNLLGRNTRIKTHVWHFN